MSWVIWTRPLPIGTYHNIYSSKNNSGLWTLVGTTTGDEYESWIVPCLDDGSTWGFSVTTVDPTNGESLASGVFGVASKTCVFDHRWGGTIDLAGESVSGPKPVWAFNPPQQLTFCADSMTFLFTKGLGQFNSTDAHVWGYLDVYNYSRCGVFTAVIDASELELIQTLMFDLPVGTFQTGGGSNTTISLPDGHFRFLLRMGWDDSGGFDSIPITSNVFTVNNAICSPVALGWTPPLLPLVRRARAWVHVVG